MNQNEENVMEEVKDKEERECGETGDGDGGGGGGVVAERRITEYSVVVCWELAIGLFEFRHEEWWPVLRNGRHFRLWEIRREKKNREREGFFPLSRTNIAYCMSPFSQINNNKFVFSPTKNTLYFS